MKLATNPRRRIEATMSIAPTINVSVAEAANSDAASPSGTIVPNAAAARIASVVVVLTLSTREVLAPRK